MEIKMVQCPNGHYYNAAVHTSCPQCEGGVGQTVPVGSPIPGASVPPTVPIGGAPGGVGAIPNTTPATGGGVEGFSQTVIGGEELPGQEPVVGWLVCVDGPNRGRDYRIHAGYNYIGREMGDVRIPDDNQISRQNHAMIAYDSMDHAYYFGPSGGRNLIRVNGKSIFNAVEIHNYDIITLGASNLIFVGLCGAHFDWSEGKSNG